jgi:PIN domain nuclease of toxin-antitoxin system
VRELFLDSNTFIWSLFGHPRITAKVQNELRASKNFVSQVTAIEIAIKMSIGRFDLPSVFGRDFSSAFHSGCRDLDADVLNLEHEDIDRLSRLPLVHRDPFDRLIICQALSRGLTVVTGDRAFKAYAGLDVLEI